MRTQTLSASIIAVVGLLSLARSSADDALPWAFKGKPAEGCSIDLVSVTPAPGSPLAAGSSVEFKLAVSYALTIAKHARILLVFQDEKNRSAKMPQVTVEVTDSSGSAVLSDTVVVPRAAKELRLFVPIVPDGVDRTSGELTFRYPIKK